MLLCYQMSYPSVHIQQKHIIPGTVSLHPKANQHAHELNNKNSLLSLLIITYYIYIYIYIYYQKVKKRGS